MLRVMGEVRDLYPGIFIHSVNLSETIKDDQKAGWFGNVNLQLGNVSEQLASIPELSGGFDAVGFSQGGQFFRAYVERYNSPPVHNLITVGSQHMGVSDLPLCSPWDVFCQLARRAAKGGVYSEWAQENLVQAQYFRDPSHLPSYLSSNKFLASINNELPESINTTYAANFKSLNKFVMVLFLQDKTVVPKESSWFGSYAPPPPEEDSSDLGKNPFEKKIIPMRMQPLYTEDWIGLKTLDERGGVVLETCEGEHMQLSGACWDLLLKNYVGGDVSGERARAEIGGSEAQVVLV